MLSPRYSKLSNGTYLPTLIHVFTYYLLIHQRYLIFLYNLEWRSRIFIGTWAHCRLNRALILIGFIKITTNLLRISVFIKSDGHAEISNSNKNRTYERIWMISSTLIWLIELSITFGVQFGLTFCFKVVRHLKFLNSK